MSPLNLDLSQKVLKYYHTWHRKGNKIVFVPVSPTEVVVPVEISSPRKFNYTSDRLFLLQGKELLGKKRCEEVSKSYRVENWVYKEVGSRRYNQIHALLKQKSLIDYCNNKALSLELFDQTIPVETAREVLSLLTAYKKLKKVGPEEFRFELASRDLDFTSFLNDLCKRYVLKKESYVYRIKLVEGRERDVVGEISRDLKTYVINNPHTYYKPNDKTVHHSA